jgi:hypothetical protein
MFPPQTYIRIQRQAEDISVSHLPDCKSKPLPKVHTQMASYPALRIPSPPPRIQSCTLPLFGASVLTLLPKAMCPHNCARTSQRQISHSSELHFLDAPNLRNLENARTSVGGSCVAPINHALSLRSTNHISSRPMGDMRNLSRWVSMS